MTASTVGGRDARVLPVTPAEPARPVERAFTMGDGTEVVADVFGAPTGKSSTVCIPGLTRNARDFTELGERLAKDRQVVAVDLRGRGRSGRDPTAATYAVATYAADVLQICAALGLDRAVWIGTSLGGMVSMYAASRQPSRIAGIVLNDIGPALASEGVARISAYAGKQGPVDSWEAAVAQVRMVSEQQAPGLSEAAWRREARRRYRETDDGRVVLDYDQGIVNGPPPTEDPWDWFGRLDDLPLLLLRGELSDLLSADTAQRMLAGHPAMRLVEVPERGHAPLLDEPAALEAIDAFLEDVDRTG
jgi:pimeloyl-ACP methyl ester carboxylesterase